MPSPTPFPTKVVVVATTNYATFYFQILSYFLSNNHYNVRRYMRKVTLSTPRRRMGGVDCNSIHFNVGAGWR